MVLALAEAVPGAGEGEEARAAAVAVRGEHRADAAVVVGVGADHDRVGAHAVEHRAPGVDRQAVDCAPELGDRVGPPHGPADSTRAVAARQASPPPCTRTLQIHEARRPHRLLGARAHRRRPARDRPGGRARSATTRCGRRRPTAPTRRRSSAGSPAATRRSSSASAIFQMPGRSAAMTAMTAATLDQLSDGRMLLGIGSSGPQVAEGWHGQRFGQQLQRTREYVAVVRKALSRERLEFHGETLELPLPDGPGQGAEADDRPGAGRDPDLPRGDRARRTPRSPARSPTAGCRRCSRPSTCRSSCPLLEEGAARVPGKRLDGLRHRPDRQRDDHRRRRRRPRRRCARSSRSTSAGWARARRTSTTSSRSATGYDDAARRGPGPLPRRQARRGDGRAPRRADRHGRRCAGPADRGPRAAGGLPRRGRRHADRLADGVRRPRTGSSSCASSPSWPPPSAALRVRILLGAFGDPGHAFPMLALGERLVERGPRGVPADVAALGGRRRGGGDARSRRRRSTRCSRRSSGR